MGFRLVPTSMTSNDTPPQFPLFVAAAPQFSRLRRCFCEILRRCEVGHIMALLVKFPVSTGVASVLVQNSGSPFTPKQDCESCP